jgi:hypothetical protein
MAQLVWCVLCRKGVLDKYTNQMSLLDVIDELTIAPAQPIPADARDIFLSVQFHVVSLWVRSDMSVPETLRFRTVISGPNNRTSPGPETEINLREFVRSRHITRFEALPFHGAGQYRFFIERYSAEREGWERLTSIPLEVKIINPTSPSQASPVEAAAADSPPLRPTRAFE